MEVPNVYLAPIGRLTRWALISQQSAVASFFSLVSPSLSACVGSWRKPAEDREPWKPSQETSPVNSSRSSPAILVPFRPSSPLSTQLIPVQLLFPLSFCCSQQTLTFAFQSSKPFAPFSSLSPSVLITIPDTRLSLI